MITFSSFMYMNRKYAFQIFWENLQKNSDVTSQTYIQLLYWNWKWINSRNFQNIHFLKSQFLKAALKRRSDEAAPLEISKLPKQTFLVEPKKSAQEKRLSLMKFNV